MLTGTMLMGIRLEEGVEVGSVEMDFVRVTKTVTGEFVFERET